MNLSRIRRPDPYGLLVLTVGITVLLEAFLRHFPERVEAVLPFLPDSTSRRALFVIGILLIYLSEQVGRRKRAAWIITVSLLVTLVFVTISRHFAWPLLLCYGAVLLFFLKEKDAFNVRSDTTSLRRAVALATVQVMVAAIIIAAIFVILDQREFGVRLTSSQTLHYTVNAMLSESFPSNIRINHYDEVLIDMLRYTVLFVISVVIWNLFRPIRVHGSSSRTARKTAQSILEQYSVDSEDFFKIYPHDKHYFFYGKSFLAYAVRAGVCLVLDGGTGPANESKALRQSFVEHCRRNGWRVAIIHAGESEMEAWQTHDMASIQIGSEAVIDSHAFVRETVRNKHFRYVVNRARKDNLTVEWWHPPLSTEQLRLLDGVSTAWIANGKQEYDFIMAPFSEDYLRNCEIAVLQQDGSVVAYANIIPTFAAVKTASVDHMRSVAGVSSVAMHFLLKACIEQTHDAGFDHFNLGFVPLAKIESSSTKISNRIVTAIRQMGSRFYSSQGLEQFKGKFEPDWSPRYLLYQGGIRQLPMIATALMQVSSHHTHTKRIPKLPVALMVLSGILYASFPLAFLLNRPYAWQGLVSTLGSDGQPFSWFFNSSDIVSSVLAVGVFTWILRSRRLRANYLRYALVSALIATIGALVAAVVTMPDDKIGADGQLSLELLHSPAIVVHGLASFVNSGAFVGAALLWSLHWRNKHGFNWRILLATVIILISTVGFVVGQLIPGWSGTIQRVFIVLYAVWFVVFAVDLLRAESQRRTR